MPDLLDMVARCAEELYGYPDALSLTIWPAPVDMEVRWTWARDRGRSFGTMSLVDDERLLFTRRWGVWS